jgi:hypothetical protein
MSELSSKSLLAQAHNHVSDAKFFIEADQRDQALESIEMLYNIAEVLYDRLVESVDNPKGVKK